MRLNMRMTNGHEEDDDDGYGLGLEGTAAAQASDFAFTKFHFLRRALLVHGHWSALLTFILDH